jgi:hypothetical protein
VAAAAVGVAAARARDRADEHAALRLRGTSRAKADAGGPPMSPWALEAPTPAQAHHEGATAVERGEADRAGGVLAPDEAAEPATTTGAITGPVTQLLAPKDKPAEDAPATSGPVSSTAPQPVPADDPDAEGETSTTAGGMAAPGS